jgi:hypothetical protein
VLEPTGNSWDKPPFKKPTARVGRHHLEKCLSDKLCKHHIQSGAESILTTSSSAVAAVGKSSAESEGHCLDTALKKQIIIGNDTSTTSMEERNSKDTAS